MKMENDTVQQEYSNHSITNIHWKSNQGTYIKVIIALKCCFPDLHIMYSAAELHC